MLPPFENFSLNALNSEGKPSAKTSRPAGQPAMILKFTGRVGSRKSCPVPSLVYVLISLSSIKPEKASHIPFKVNVCVQHFDGKCLVYFTVHRQCEFGTLEVTV